MGVKSLVQVLNAAATAGFEPRTVWSEVRRRNRLGVLPAFSPLGQVWAFQAHSQPSPSLPEAAKYCVV